MRDRPRFQFGLGCLFFAMTAFAVVLSIAVIDVDALWRLMTVAFAGLASFYALIVGIAVFQWIKAPETDAEMHAGRLRTLFRSRWFWSAFGLTFLAAVCLNVIPYYLSYEAYKFDGCEVAGWPLRFFVHRGAYTERVYPLAFLVDALVAMGLATASGISFRNGVGPLVWQAYLLIRRARTWPHNDDCQGDNAGDRSDSSTTHATP